MPKRWTVVKLPPQTRDVYFVVDLDWDEFSVDERQCPSDLFRGCEQIIIDGDTDPHGLFEYVRNIDEPDFLNRTHNPHEEWPKVIPEAFPEKR